MITDAEVDAAAVELRATLETMLAGVDDRDVERLGVAPSQAVWRPTHPEASCWICCEPLPGIYATSRVAHTACVEYQDRGRR